MGKADSAGSRLKYVFFELLTIACDSWLPVMQKFVVPLGTYYYLSKKSSFFNPLLFSSNTLL